MHNPSMPRIKGIISACSTLQRRRRRRLCREHYLQRRGVDGAHSPHPEERQRASAAELDQESHGDYQGGDQGDHHAHLGDGAEIRESVQWGDRMRDQARPRTLPYDQAVYRETDRPGHTSDSSTCRMAGGAHSHTHQRDGGRQRWKDRMASFTRTRVWTATNRLWRECDVQAAEEWPRS